MSQLTFKHMSLRNFMSYGNAPHSVDLNHSGTTIITGENLDSTADGQGANGVGKAQPLTTRILTPYGWVKMKDIAIGDVVLTPSGEPSRVTGVFPQGVRPVYEIVGSDGRKTFADPEHLWTVIVDGVTMTINTLEVMDIISQDIPIMLPEIIHPNLPRCESIDAADLWNRWYWSRNPTDLTEELSDLLFYGNIRQKYRFISMTYDACGEYHFGPILKTLPVQHSAFIIDLIRSLGGYAEECLGDVHFEVKVDHIVDSLQSQTEYMPIHIAAVRKVRDQEVQCIKIDHKDSLYIADDYVVTHNTTIINAITYAVYGKPVSSITANNLINNINKKNMEVEVEFIAPNGKTYNVRRTRRLGTASDNSVYLNEVVGDERLDITPDSITNTNLLIEQIVGIPYDLFVRIVVFSASHTPFLDLPSSGASSANQRNIIEELFGLTLLTDKANLLKEFIKSSETSLKTQQIKIQSLEDAHKRHNDQIESAKLRISNWEAKRADDIDDCKSLLESVSDTDVDAQYAAHTELKAHQDELKSVKAEHSFVENAIKQLSAKHKQLVHELEQLRDSTCPYCEQHFAGSEEKSKSVGDQIDQIVAEVEQLAEEAQSSSDKIAEVEKRLTEVREKITVDDVEELMAIASQSTQIASKIIDLESAENPHADALNELINTNLEDIDYTEINKVADEIEHQKFLLKLLTKKDSFVRKALLNKNIPFLNNKLAEYLSAMGLPHRVEFTHEMTASISQFGHSLDFGNLSAGQRARVNLALAFAFRDVLQSMHMKVNICLLDEALDHGLDTVGVNAAVKLLRQKAREDDMCMFIITHRDVDAQFDRIMTVQMKDGFSHIVTQ